MPFLRENELWFGLMHLLVHSHLWHPSLLCNSHIHPNSTGTHLILRDLFLLDTNWLAFDINEFDLGYQTSDSKFVKFVAQGPAIFLFSFAFADCLHSFKLLIKILHPCTMTMVIKVGFLHLSIGDGIDEFRSWESKWKILISVALVALTWMNQIPFTIFCLFFDAGNWLCI